MNPTLGIALLLLACCSPLLTFASLWQIKEWRIDRLQEHLRTEGWLRQLFGTVRPIIALTGILIVSMAPAYSVGLGILGILALLSLVQILLKKQRYPVWTAKTCILIAICTLLTLLAGYGAFATSMILVLAVPLLEPFFLFIAWSLFWPADHWMKMRIMHRATALRERYANATVIGITGSVGKTTTKELIAHILRDENLLFTPAYVNSEMGVAQWLLRELPKKNTDDELIIIVEMGAYREGEIRKLCDMVKPVIGIVTFIGTQHIALFGSQEKLCQAKGELPASLPRNGTALLNGDNELCGSLKENIHAKSVTVGTGGHADIEAFDIEETGNGIRFRVGDTVITSKLHGTHNVTNVLLAIGAARELGTSDTAIAKALQSFEPPHNTFSVRNENGVTVLDDTHNASPESFRAAIAWAKSQPMHPKILVTPGLIELGIQGPRIHRELGARAAGVFDRVLFTGSHGIRAFSEGFGTSVEIYQHPVTPAEPGALIVCIGRTSKVKIDNLIP